MQLTAEKQFIDQIQSMRDRIFRVTKRILISKEEAEDATQEVIIKLWNMDQEKRSSFKNIEAYSITMAKNYCLDRLKSKQAQVLTLNEQLSTRQSNSLIKQIQASDEMSWVAKIIDALPEKERLIIQLREIEQYDFDQIASLLEIPEGTVRVYLSRTRKKIKKQFLEIQEHGI
ncbi:sigma-70 family RNA polymerase sigma factor [Flavobacteriaceae bacterium]|jgi:RNA polymerase sigma factor (sigma-70 family)|nr:sigma-70 family RNA polymerase sigma factor [Flavobacteriaceae bacterium]MDA8877486.1 sigma-70 family RNA polymerase sigma factor [Flavobacteriaceae bacterium]MDA9587970.1 sigma-70 family RNA polymerase sigma factor [Flavobacteriaceae bacterium]MDA9851501.1 sigma-70 family RNA polymerase sigma factor [Flavobacteriaceae bacterium]MDC0386680.1 sigma-70 family RNA polymerase sigma factor [Flavobacteriaceae bacterium]